MKHGPLRIGTYSRFPDYEMKTYGTGYVEDANGIRRPLTEEESAKYAKALRKSFSQCKEVLNGRT